MEAALSRLRWEALGRVERLGWPGVLGVLLALACAIGWLTWVAPQARDTERLRDDNARMQADQARRATQTPAAAAVALEDPFASFGARFPNERGIATVLTRMHAAALRHGLQMPQAEFRLSQVAGDPLARYAIVLPLRADYRSLRSFVDEVLREVPGMALEEISLRRDDAQAHALESRLRFVLFVATQG